MFDAAASISAKSTRIAVASSHQLFISKKQFGDDHHSADAQT
jgi:hypothetical protein